MRKTMLMMVAALIMLPATAMAQNPHRGGYGGPAYHGGGHHGGYRGPGPGAWVGPALGGLALGAIVGGIINNQQQQYAPPPVVYAAPPAYYAPPPVVYQAVPAYAPMICRMVPYDVLPNGTTMYRQECRD